MNTKVPRKFTVCIRFQLGSSFVDTKVPRKYQESSLYLFVFN